ncbi:hypothetical protein HMI54_011911 [Coelomomyces lativittatus]|nr:hypothetical protein HMI54_011911 [Coelomomyces lativittatus]
MNNFYILNEVGHILFSQNYKGEPLDKSVIIGFSSSLPNLCLSLLNDNVQQVNCNNSKLIFSFSNKYIFLAHIEKIVSSYVVSTVLIELVYVLSLILGPSEIWNENTTFEGCQDIIDLFCVHGLTDPNILLGSINQLPVSKEGRLRLDKLFVYLESVQSICSNACMLILDNAVVYSRFELEPTRHVSFISFLLLLFFNFFFFLIIFGY